MGNYTERLAQRLNKKLKSAGITTRRFNRNEPVKYHFAPKEHRQPPKPEVPTAESTHLMNGEYFPQDEYPADKGLWNGSCNRGQCLRPGAKWWNFGSHAYYCTQCAHMLNSDRFNFTDAQRTWGPGSLLCELQPTEELLPSRKWLK